MKPVLFNNTVLRDGHQSLAATRMSTAQMLPAAAELDALGFNMLETWGGATIDSCLRFLGENPFDRITALKEKAPKTPHSLLLRGQNIVQYTCFPDDVVEAFIRCTARRGMDIFRVFDALNDDRNVEVAVKAVLKEGKHAQGAISYTVSPAHTLEAFVKLGRRFEELGCQSVCIKDMAGLITPQAASQLVRALKGALRIPIVLHSHSTAGLAPSSYLAAIEAGVDQVDVSISPFANGSGQPDTLLMLAMLEGTPRAPSFDKAALYRLRDHFTKVYAELDTFTSRTNERVDLEILRTQIPGGMLSNFITQLKEQGMADRLEDVLNEMPYVRQCLGWIPLVTPTSQIVGSQALLNVKFGRWQTISQPCVDIVLGKYGRTPAPIEPELLKLVVKKTGEQPIEGRPADQLKPRMETLKAELRAKNLPDDEETAVLYAMFPQQVTDLKNGKAPVAPKAPAAAAPKAAPSAGSEAKVIRSRQFRLNINGRQEVAIVEELEG
jgi:pyruvate carboxylase subunit B